MMSGGGKLSEYKTRILKDAVKEAVEHLPEEKVAEVFDFVSYLLAREKEGRREKGDEKGRELDPKKDPIVRYYIGGVSHGSLAKENDRELYWD